jgi:hypothetical protein
MFGDRAEVVGCDLIHVSERVAQAGVKRRVIARAHRAQELALRAAIASVGVHVAGEPLVGRR